MAKVYLFWDEIPFMNVLYLLEEYRGKGYGKQLVDYCEKEMLKNNYQKVLTSTLSNEQAQFFYRKKWICWLRVFTITKWTFRNNFTKKTNITANYKL